MPVTRIGAYAFVMMASGRLVSMPTTTPETTGGRESLIVAAKKPSANRAQNAPFKGYS